MFGSWGKSTGVCWLTAVAAVAVTRAGATASEFRFDRDTFAFQNATVLKYHDGIAFFRPKSEADDPANKYTRRCFVMTRTVIQFRKFARFARAQVFQDNIGSGFVTYFRPSNIRMVFLQSPGYQQKTHANLDAALSRGDVFVAYLSTYPKMSINHSVLIYGRKKSHPGDEIERYFVYDPNHAEAPRELTWSPSERAFAYQKDIDFIGGFVRVYQTYDKPLQ